MKRRNFLAVVASGVTVGFSSFLHRSNPKIAAEEPELSPESETTIYVRATDTVGFTLLPQFGTDGIQFDLDETNWEPSQPERITHVFVSKGMPFQTDFWVWETQQTIEAEIPVTIRTEVSSGEYPYGIGALCGDSVESASQEEKVFHITVV